MIDIIMTAISAILPMTAISNMNLKMFKEIRNAA
jgi:hypothetical protein